MPDFEAVLSFFASNLRGGGDDLQQWDRHIRPLATGQTVKGGWLVGWLPGCLLKLGRSARNVCTQVNSVLSKIKDQSAMKDRVGEF